LHQECALPQYHFNVRDRRGVTQDIEGNSFDYLGEALDEAKATARDLALQLIDNPSPLEDLCVEVTDEDGTVLAALPVEEVLKHPNFPKFKPEC
jgi:hypothetical protein